MIVTHIITTLGNGGAEGVLYRLITHSDRNTTHRVISLTSAGKYGPLLREHGIDVQTLDFPKGRITFTGSIKLYKLLKDNRIDIIQTWMYHADLIGGLIARLAGHKNIVWGIRSATVPTESKLTKLIAKLCALTSGFIPQCTISCTLQGVEYHQALGYKGEIVVIHNGYNMALYNNPQANAYPAIVDNNLSQNNFTLGMIGRWDPIKDHENLFKALSKWSLDDPSKSFTLILVGLDCSESNPELTQLLSQYNLKSQTKLLGELNDIPKILPTFDIHLLSSKSEGFANVLAEAMASGVPCIATDVGDNRLILGDYGWLVPAQNSTAFARSINDAYSLWNDKTNWHIRMEKCRQHIDENFSIQNMVSRYDHTWKHLINDN